MRGSPEINRPSVEIQLSQVNLPKPSTTAGPSKTSTPIPSTLFSLFDDPDTDDSDEDMEQEEDEEIFGTPLADPLAEYGVPSPEANTTLLSNPDLSGDVAGSDWDNGEEITSEERMFLLTLGSDLERARAMSIQRRDRDSLDEGLISQIPSMIPKSSVAAKEQGVAANKASKRKGPSKTTTKKTTSMSVSAAAKKKGTSTSVSAAAEKKVASASVTAAAKKKVANTSVTAAAKKKASSTSESAIAKKKASPIASLAPAKKAPSISDNNPSIDPLATLTTIETILSSASSAPPVLSNVSYTEVDEDEVPEWMEELMPNLSAMCEGPRWTSLLVKWIDLERQLRFPKGRVSNS